MGNTGLRPDEAARLQYRDVVIVKGKDAILWDENGNEYIDCAAGIGVATIGHCNEKVVEAITNQARTLITNPGIFYNIGYVGGVLLISYFLIRFTIAINKNKIVKKDDEINEIGLD